MSSSYYSIVGVGAYVGLANIELKGDYIPFFAILYKTTLSCLISLDFANIGIKNKLWPQ